MSREILLSLIPTKYIEGRIPTFYGHTLNTQYVPLSPSFESIRHQRDKSGVVIKGLSPSTRLTFISRYCIMIIAYAPFAGCPGDASGTKDSSIFDNR